MSALGRKLVRDLRRLKGQVASIAAVVACGIVSVIAMRSTLDSIQRSRDDYYARARFPHVFASLERAPESVARRIGEIDGVATVETRVVVDALLQVPGLVTPATAHIVSVPENGAPLLSTLHIRRGRNPVATSNDEVLADEHFVDANHLAVGDSLGAVINGRWRRLRIVGVAISPEFIYPAVPGSGMFGDVKHQAILWMNRGQLGPLYEMDGAFNDVGVLLAPGGRDAAVIARLDALLAPYGGGHAYARKDQRSESVLAGEIEQLRVFGTAMPVIFLAVAAFLLNVVLSRLIATQRGEIAVLKAFGYDNRAIAVHFLGYPLVAVAFGAVGGIAIGIWVGGKYTMAYAHFFRFPSFEHHTSMSVMAVAVLVSGGAAVLGALSGVRAAVRLSPAEGMRPPAPATFKPLWLERLGWGTLVPPAARMVLRDLERRPIRTAASVIGVAFAAAILVTGIFAFDSARYMADVQFRAVDREDLAIAFASLRPERARYDLAAVRGISRVELFRVVPVRIMSGHRSRQIAITGLESGAQLRRVVDRRRRSFALPPTGLVLTTALAEILHVVPGDTVALELLERGGARRHAVVAALADELIGLGGYMELDALHRLVGESAVASGAYVLVASGAEQPVVEQLRGMPGVVGTVTRRAMIQSFDEQLAQSLRLTVSIVVVLACVVAVGVIYNGLRISLSERARDLASLRVLGFTRREVAALLFGEQGAIDAVGTPLGLALGLALAYWIATGFASESYRFPIVITARTYLFSAAVVVVAAVAASATMRRRIYDLDLVAVLKTRE